MKVILSQEEKDLLDLVSSNKDVKIERMKNERHQAVATELVARGILLKNDKGIITANSRRKK